MSSQSNFKLIMLSAMYENGGNTTHRLLDGHPELFVYPFESQLGNKYDVDFLSSVFPLKYRWPEFPSSMDKGAIYESIIDEECKVRIKTPNVSKFRDKNFDLSDKGRKNRFLEILKDRDVPTRAEVIEAFFRSTFDEWKDHQSSGKENRYVGYSPVLIVDTEKIIKDLKDNVTVFHVIRNPFSAYADTKKRAVPLSLHQYIFSWCINQFYARYFKEKYPDNFVAIRFEDIIVDPVKQLSSNLKISESGTLAKPSWNSQELGEVYPWGTIRIPTPEQNIATAKELSKEEIEEVYKLAKDYIEFFDYQDIYSQIK